MFTVAPIPTSTTPVDAQIAVVQAEITSTSADIVAAAQALQAGSDRLVKAQQRAGRDRAAQRADVRRGLLALRPRTVLTAQGRVAADAQLVTAARVLLARRQAHAAQSNLFDREAQLETELTALQETRATIVASVAPAAPASLDAAGVTAAPADGTAVALGAVSRAQWAADLETALAVPPCGANTQAIIAWQTAENTAAAWNPLATTLTTADSTGFNTSRVQNYPTLDAGLAATVATLRGGYQDNGYGWVWYDLSVCAPTQTTVQAINASDWCAGCAGGTYVTGTLPAVVADPNLANTPVAAAD